MSIPKLQSKTNSQKRKFPFLYIYLLILAFGVLFSFELSRSTFSASNETPNKFLPSVRLKKTAAAFSPTSEPRITTKAAVPSKNEFKRLNFSGFFAGQPRPSINFFDNERGSKNEKLAVYRKLKRKSLTFVNYTYSGVSRYFNAVESNFNYSTLTAKAINKITTNSQLAINFSIPQK